MHRVSQDDILCTRGASNADLLGHHFVLKASLYSSLARTHALIPWHLFLERVFVRGHILRAHVIMGF